MDIRSGNIAIEKLENGKIRIGKVSHEVFNFQEYSREEVFKLRDILDGVLVSEVLDCKKLEREEKYR